MDQIRNWFSVVFFPNFVIFWLFPSIFRLSVFNLKTAMIMSLVYPSFVGSWVDMSIFWRKKNCLILWMFFYQMFYIVHAEVKIELNTGKMGFLKKCYTFLHTCKFYVCCFCWFLFSFFFILSHSFILFYFIDFKMVYMVFMVVRVTQISSQTDILAKSYFFLNFRRDFGVLARPLWCRTPTKGNLSQRSCIAKSFMKLPKKVSF